MKPVYLLLLSLFGIFSSLRAQDTNLGYDFSDGAVQFAAILADAANPSYTLNVIDGVLNITVDKKAQDWSFLQLYGKEIDLTNNKTLQFNVKSDGDVNMVVRLKSPSLSDPATAAQIDITTALSPSEDFIYYYIDLSDKIAASADFDVTNINEIQIDITKGWNNSYSGLVELDDFKLGYPEALQAGGDSFAADFDSGLPAGVVSNAKYKLTADNGAMKVRTDRSSGRWAYFDVSFGSLIDMSSNPVVSFDIKSETDFVLQVFLIDGNGNGYQIEKTSTAQPTDELVLGKSDYKQIRVYKGDRFIKTSLDFSDLQSGLLDNSVISAVRFVSNGTGLSFDGTFYIDNLMVGTGAEKIAYIGQIPNLTFPAGTGVSKSIIVPEIHNAASVEITGAENLIANAQLGTINYNTTSDYYHTTTYGNAMLSFDILPDVSGSEEITFNIKGTDGYSDNTMVFTLDIAGNNPPLVDDLANKIGAVGETYTIDLSNISNGNPESSQTVTLSAASSNTDVVDTVSVAHQTGFMNGTLEFTPIAPGEVTITLTATDSEGGTTLKTFDVTVYQTLNGVPEVDDIDKANIYLNSGVNTIKLTGISDGDDMTQELEITATSSDSTVVLAPEVVYNQGDNTASLNITPGSGTGLATITLTLTDNGGNEENNGNQQIIKTFEVEVTNEPVTGATIDLEAPGALGLFGPESNNVIYFINIVDTLGSKALRVVMKDKWTYGGISMDLPQELNLAEYPIVSYEVYPVDKPWWSWNYFYDANDDRNIENTGAHQFKAEANQWTTLTFDYRDAGDLNDSEGNPIDATRIVRLLLNMHDAAPAWPFTDASGKLYIRNIKFGSEAEFDPYVPTCTFDQLADQVVFETAGHQAIAVHGISDGDGTSDNVSISFATTQDGIIDNLAIDPVDADGNSSLEFDIVGNGKTIVTVTVESANSTTYEMKFAITVFSSNVNTTSVSYDLEDEQQTIRGFGTFYTESRFADLYTNDLGATAVRIGIIGNQWEPVNDNDDPDVINMKGFNYDAFDWAYFRKLKEQGVKTFMLTSWSPPAWMKRNLSLDHREQAIQWEKNDNILEPYYYEEFAESMVAVVKAFKDRCGIELTAIGLQNEPYFNEPYPSAIISGEELGKLIAIAGKRFEKEGLSNVSFFSPEQVFGRDWGKYSVDGYLASLRENSTADAYVKYFAVHGYDGSGITSGFPDYSNWSELWDKISAEPNAKEMWMSETHIAYEDWQSAIRTAGAIHGSLWAGNISLWTNWAFETMQLTKNKPNPTFYASKNYFKYIRPGAVRVQTSSAHKDLMPTAFVNEDGQFVQVIINKGEIPLPTYINGQNLPQSFRVYRTSSVENFVETGEYKPADAPLIIPASSIVTLVADKMNPLSIGQIENVSLPQGTEYTVSITNISNPDADLSTLSLSYQLSKESLLENVALSDIQSDGTATLSFTASEELSGNTVVKLVLSDDEGNTVSTTFVVTVEIVEGVKLKDSAGSVKLYPLPANQKLQVELPENVFDAYQVFDATGRNIIKDAVHSSRFEITTNHLAKGIYFMHLTGRQNNTTIKFTVQH